MSLADAYSVVRNNSVVAPLPNTSNDNILENHHNHNNDNNELNIQDIHIITWITHVDNLWVHSPA